MIRLVNCRFISGKFAFLQDNSWTKLANSETEENSCVNKFSCYCSSLFCFANQTNRRGQVVVNCLCEHVYFSHCRFLLNF
jgi:hypothetical protein